MKSTDRNGFSDMRKCLVILLLALLCCHISKAQEILRPVAASYTLAVGSLRLNDTYLTPLEYTGSSYSFTYERFQAMKFSPEKWVQNLRITAGFGTTQNPARNADMLTTGLSASWGMLRKWNIPQVNGLSLSAGGMVEGNIGALYLSRNGNNPVTAKASVTLAPAGLAVYNFKINRLPVTLFWQTSLPLLGAFFSQQYGELYYEIYLGDKKGLARFASPASYFRFCNTVAADLRLGGTFIRVGYNNNLTSTRAHNITTNISSHSLVIGLSGEWLSLNPRKPVAQDARTISAIY